MHRVQGSGAGVSLCLEPAVDPAMMPPLILGPQPSNGSNMYVRAGVVLAQDGDLTRRPLLEGSFLLTRGLGLFEPRNPTGLLSLTPNPKLPILG